MGRNGEGAGRSQEGVARANPGVGWEDGHGVWGEDRGSWKGLGFSLEGTQTDWERGRGAGIGFSLGREGLSSSGTPGSVYSPLLTFLLSSSSRRAPGATVGPASSWPA